MNPLTLVRRTQNINAKEAELGISDQASWHANYSHSAYVFAGGLPFDLTEGDLLAVFAQYGEIVDVNLVREKSTGKSKGFAFIAYEDQRSTTLAVDNLNGAQIAGRTIRVDHVSNYKKKEEEDEETERQKREERGVCRAFQRGECKYGDSCKFSHDEQRAANTGWGPEEERKAKAAHNKFEKRPIDVKRSHDLPPSRARHEEDQDKQTVERRSSRYESESKKSRDRDGKEEMKPKRHDTHDRDKRDERDRDRSRDRGRDIDKDGRDKDRERKKQSFEARDYHGRERDIDDHRESRRDKDYHRSRR